MTRDLRGAIRWIAPPTVALLVVAALAPGRLELALRIYALIVAAAVIIVALLALRRAFPAESALSAAPSGERRPLAPASLARVHNEVVLGVSSAFDFHYRLAPRLRTIAGGLLSSRRDVSLTGRPGRAEEILGPRTWELIRPDRSPPTDRLAAGIAPADLADVVDSVEAV